MNDTNIDQLLGFAKETAQEAGAIMRRYYRSSDATIELKKDGSPVTIADKAINSLLIQRVQSDFPEHGVLGEEEVWHPERDQLWVCDPIDGTSSFIMHMPTFTFALSFVVSGEPQVAVVLNPMTQELFWAAQGKGAWLNDEPITVSERAWGAGGRLMRQASPSQRNLLDQHELARSLRQSGVHLIASHGAVWSGILVADGSADGYIYEGNSAHDIAAVKLIVEEAGGRGTGLAGQHQHYNAEIHGAIISNGVIHNQLVAITKEKHGAHTRD